MLPPVQIFTGPVIVEFIPFESVTVVLAVSPQLPLLTNTEYVVLAVGVTVMEAVLEPVVQE